MKKPLLILAALALPGCTALLPAALETIVSVAKPAEAVSDKVVLEGTRALVIAHNAYQGTATLAAAAVRSGKLSPQQVDAIEKANAKALSLLNGADSTLSAAERAAAVLNATNDLSMAMGR